MPADSRRLPVPEDSKSPLVYATRDVSPIELVNKNGRRIDGRQVRQTRPVYLRAGAVSQAKGSAYIELNNTKVICAVYGPREVIRREEFSMKGQLSCHVKFATFSRQERCQHQQDNVEKALSMGLRQALEPSICLDKFPKARLDVFVTILEDGGSALSAATSCASVALANGGIEMYDLVVGMSVRQLGSLSLLDPGDKEQYTAKLGEPVENNGSVTLGFMPSIQQVAAVVQQGQMDITMVKECVKLCVAACERMYPILQQALVKPVTNKPTCNTISS